jgi:hypothetical protein
MVRLFGVFLVFLAVALLLYVRPRAGRPARFVNSQWEPYVTVLIVGAFGFGVLMAATGVSGFGHDFD